MNRLREWMLRVGGMFRKRQKDAELAEELAAHLEMLVEQNVERGMTPQEARRAARIALGGGEQIKEAVRQQRGLPWFESLIADVRFGFRILRKSPGFTTVAILTLALGIGANTAIFSLIDALLLRSLPVSNPQELVFLKWAAPKLPHFHSISGYGDCAGGIPAGGCTFSLPFFNELRGRTALFSSVAASGYNAGITVVGSGPASVAQGLLVSGNYFDMLGVRPLLGRTIEASDDQSSAAPVVMLSYGYWLEAFGGSLSAIGKSVDLNGVPTSIIGVAARKFTGLTPGNTPDVWLPLSLRARIDPYWKPSDEDSGSLWLLIVGRLSPGVPIGKAQAAVSLLFHNEMVHGAEPLSTEVDAPSATLVSTQTGLVGARGIYSRPLFFLMAAVAIILLIASANVAGLLLARSATRQKEIALRLALGAGRGRVIRQLLTESMLLSGFGGVAGIFLAFWGVQTIVAFISSSESRPLGIAASIDMRVFAFTAGVVIFSGVLSGLAPALRGMRVDLTPALKEGSSSRGRTGRRWLNAGNFLVIVQVGLTMIVLAGAGLVVRTLQNLREVDPGFETANLLNFRVDATLAGYKGSEIDAVYRGIQDQLRFLPGVLSVSYSAHPLLNNGLTINDLHLPGTPDDSSVEADFLQVGPDFFATMKIPV
ncbi:MAG TPA: ABC transporter permease, partial [Terriglobales bacterium]|nr:ABC transporter permease [Terriglobales bacterium]